MADSTHTIESYVYVRGSTPDKLIEAMLSLNGAALMKHRYVDFTYVPSEDMWYAWTFTESLETYMIWKKKHLGQG